MAISSTCKPVRILLIDDEAMVRTGLRMVLESSANVQVVGEAGNRSEALALAAREKPDLILLDLKMRDCSGLDFLPDLIDAASGTRIVILTGVEDPDLHIEAVRRGAVGVVLKGSAAEVLLKAIEKIHAGEVWLDRSMIAKVLFELSPTAASIISRDPDAQRISNLTKREREVIDLVAQGLKNRDIADRLFISQTTVRHHLSSIFVKLDLSSRAELMIYAYRHGLATPPS